MNSSCSCTFRSVPFSVGLSPQNNVKSFLLRCFLCGCFRRPWGFIVENRRHLFVFQRWPCRFLRGLPGLKKNYPESFEDGIGLDPTFFNGFLQGLGLLLCNLILFFWGEGGDNLVLKFSPVFGFFTIILLIVLILFLKTHAIRFEEEIFPPQMLNILEVGF